MYKCKHCGEVIRWSEWHGWVHGHNGEGYREHCLNVETYSEATPRDEDMEWLRK